MKLIIADDDPLVLKSLKTILESDSDVCVAACCAGGEEAVAAYLKHKPDIALLDIRMDKDGLWAAREILKADAVAKIIFLTTFHDTGYIVEALDMGAAGYILKQDYEQLKPALAAVMAGGRVLGGEIMDALPALIAQKKEKDLSTYGLDEKQHKIVEAVSLGLSNKEIAASLYLSEGTVRNYISAILDILGLRDRTQLAVFYLNL